MVLHNSNFLGSLLVGTKNNILHELGDTLRVHEQSYQAAIFELVFTAQVESSEYGLGKASALNVREL